MQNCGIKYVALKSLKWQQFILADRGSSYWKEWNCRHMEEFWLLPFHLPSFTVEKILHSHNTGEFRMSHTERGQKGPSDLLEHSLKNSETTSLPILWSQKFNKICVLIVSPCMCEHTHTWMSLYKTKQTKISALSFYMKLFSVNKCLFKCIKFPWQLSSITTDLASNYSNWDFRRKL